MRNSGFNRYWHLLIGTSNERQKSKKEKDYRCVFHFVTFHPFISTFIPMQWNPIYTKLLHLIYRPPHVVAMAVFVCPKQSPNFMCRCEEGVRPDEAISF